jgi:hypothetical protein
MLKRPLNRPRVLIVSSKPADMVCLTGMGIHNTNTSVVYLPVTNSSISPREMVTIGSTSHINWRCWDTRGNTHHSR